MRTLSRLSTLGILFALLSGCVTLQEIDPLYVTPDFHSKSIDNITLLPVVDVRVDKDLEADYQEVVSELVLGFLRKRGYQVDITTRPIEGISFTTLPTDVKDPEWVKRLTPEYNEWVLLVTFNKLVREITFQATVTAELSGYLFRRGTGTLEWSHTAQGDIRFGLLFLPLLYNDSLRITSYNLTLAFPIKRTASAP
jgi:hypothetical protein